MGIVYHYTNFKALIGILGAGNPCLPTFRLTHMSFTNDSLEAQFFEDVRRHMIESRPNLGEFGERALTALAKLEVGFQPYVMSFSEARDSLAQWRAYARGPTGVCLGLEMADIPLIPLPCDYREPDEASDKVEVMDIIRRASLWAREDDEREAVKELIRMASARKSSAFREEQEIRYVTFEAEPAGFRSGPFGIAPYAETRIMGSVFREIMLGPAAVPRSARRGLEMLLQHKGMDHVEVTESEASTILR